MLKTKLVYVLTCAPETTYIEQALMAVWSARYWNPNAHIVLLTDDKTSALMHTDGTRGEILQYISEEIVTTFDTDKSMHYRSRWIKTQVRELVKGNMLFVDCDTICCRSLQDVDFLDCEVGAVLESHLPVAEWNASMLQQLEPRANMMGWSTNDECFYFSSGVIYCKDTPLVHHLYHLWHSVWLDGVVKGVNIDQPALARANIECGHIIQQISDDYNRILFTETPHTEDAYILHIAAYRNPSFLFKANTLTYIREYGLKNNGWLCTLILHPCWTFRPFDYDLLHSVLEQRLRWLCELTQAEYYYLRKVCDRRVTRFCVFNRLLFWMLQRRWHVLRHSKSIKDNILRKEM